MNVRLWYVVEDSDNTVVLCASKSFAKRELASQLKSLRELFEENKRAGLVDEDAVFDVANYGNPRIEEKEFSGSPKWVCACFASQFSGQGEVNTDDESFGMMKGAKK